MFNACGARGLAASSRSFSIAVMNGAGSARLCPCGSTGVTRPSAFGTASTNPAVLLLLPRQTLAGFRVPAVIGWSVARTGTMALQ